MLSSSSSSSSAAPTSFLLKSSHSSHDRTGETVPTIAPHQQASPPRFVQIHQPHNNISTPDPPYSLFPQSLETQNPPNSFTERGVRQTTQSITPLDDQTALQTQSKSTQLLKEQKNLSSTYPMSFDTEVPVKEVEYVFTGAVFGRNRRKQLKAEKLALNPSEAVKKPKVDDAIGDSLQMRNNFDILESSNAKMLQTTINSFASEPDQDITPKNQKKLLQSQPLIASPVTAPLKSSLKSGWFARRVELLRSSETNLQVTLPAATAAIGETPTAVNQRMPFSRKTLVNNTPETSTPKRNGQDETEEQMVEQASPTKKLSLFTKALQSSSGGGGEATGFKAKWNFAVQLKNVNRFISKIRDQTSNQNFTKLLPQHLNLINDASFQPEGGSKDYFDIGQKESERNAASSFLQKVPIFDPDDSMLITFKIIVLLVLVALLFLLPFVFSFDFQEDEYSLMSKLLAREIPTVIFASDVACRLNTGFYKNGSFVQDRAKIPKFFGLMLALDALNILAIQLNRFFSPGVLMGVFVIRFIQVYVKTSDLLEHFPILERYPMFYNLTKLAFILFIILHTCGCGFHYIATIQPEEDTTWLDYYGYDEFTAMNRYIVSIYYSTITMITVGYGDITPKTQVERMYVIIVVIVSGTVFAYTVNMIGQLFQEKEKKEAVFKQKKFDISNYMMNRSISKKTQLRVYNYLDYINRKADESPEKGQMILTEISENLRNEVYREFYGKILTNSKLFSNKFSHAFITKLSLHMEEKMFGPGEVIFLEGSQNNACLYYVLKGKIEMYSKHYEVKHSLGFLSVLFFNSKKYYNQEGDSMGHRCFNASQPQDWSAMTAEVTHLVYVTQKNFLECLKEFPQDLETFMMMREDIIFGQNRYINPCNCCGKVTHLSMECPLVHYSKNRQLCIHKHLHNVPEKDRKPYLRHRLSKSNILRLLPDVKSKLKKFRIELSAMHSQTVQNSTSYDSAESDKEFYYRMSNKFTFSENSNSLILDSKPSESDSYDEDDYDDEDSNDERGDQSSIQTPSLHPVIKPYNHLHLSKISDDSEIQSDDSILTSSKPAAADNYGGRNGGGGNQSSKPKQRFFRDNQIRFHLDDFIGGNDQGQNESNKTTPFQSLREITTVFPEHKPSQQADQSNNLLKMQPIKMPKPEKNMVRSGGVVGELSSILNLVKSSSNQDQSESEHGIDSLGQRTDDSPAKPSPQRRNTRSQQNIMMQNPKEASFFSKRYSITQLKGSLKQSAAQQSKSLVPSKFASSAANGKTVTISGGMAALQPYNYPIQQQIGMVYQPNSNVVASVQKKKDEFFMSGFEVLKEFTVYFPQYNYSNIVKKLNIKITLAKKRIMTLIPSNAPKKLRKRVNTIKMTRIFIPNSKQPKPETGEEDSNP